MAIKRKQGDSIWVDVTGESIEDIDAVWANWEGQWAIVTELGAAPVLSGDMIRTDTPGLFYARVGASLTGALAVRKYIMVFQVSNASVDYRQEVAHETLEITAQGIQD